MYSYALCIFLGALSFFVEEKQRRGELAMYVLPKGLESAWLTASSKGSFIPGILQKCFQVFSFELGIRTDRG
jgi:hypothetical protein